MVGSSWTLWNERTCLHIISSSLITYTEGDHIPGSLTEAGILASLSSGRELPDLFSAFMLPSHSVWLARRHYDDKKYEDCLRFAGGALNSTNSLSSAGKVEACRLLCLAATRLSNSQEFERGIRLLRADVHDRWSQSNLNFLLGFNSRMAGFLPQAELYFREALNHSRDNFWALRESAAVCKVRGNLGKVEKFARQAFGERS